MTNDGSNSQTQRSKSPFGLDQLELKSKDHEIVVVIGPESKWTTEHVRKLRSVSETAGLVPILDADFTEDGKPYAAVPVVNHPSIAEFTASKRVGWEEKVSAIAAVAEIIDSVHEKGLTHGALSPNEILITNDEVFITNVGLGKGGSAPAQAQAFCSPQVLDGKDATSADDVYSVGKLLAEYLPQNESTPRTLKRLVTWCTADQPDARPPSTREIANIIEKSLGDRKKSFNKGYVPTSQYKGLINASTIDPDGSTPAPSSKESAQPADVSFEDLAPIHDAKTPRPSTSPMKAIKSPESKTSALGSIFSKQAKPNSKVQTMGESSENRDRSVVWIGLAGLILFAGLLSAFYALTRDNDGNSQASSETTAPEPSGATKLLNPDAVSASKDADQSLQEAEEDGRLEVIHAVQSQPLDLYINDKLVAGKFSAGTMASAIMDESSEAQKIQLFTSTGNPNEIASDRPDEPAFVTHVSPKPPNSSFVAYPDGDGNIALANPKNRVQKLDAGYARVVLHNFSSDQLLSGTFDGKRFSLASGASSVYELETNQVQIGVNPAADGEEFSESVLVSEGELTNLYIYGSNTDETISLAQVNVPGLDTAPKAIPTGNSGLAHPATDLTLGLSLMVAVLLSTAGFLLRRLTVTDR